MLFDGEIDGRDTLSKDIVRTLMFIKFIVQLYFLLLVIFEISFFINLCLEIQQRVSFNDMHFLEFSVMTVIYLMTCTS